MINKIAVIGAAGFVGSALMKALKEKGRYNVVPVVRNDYEQLKQDQYDLIIHTAMPSRRWWALNNPLDDFEASVGLTADIAYTWNYNKIALISSVSARVQREHPYGRHKHLAEELLLNAGDENLIFRLGGLYGEGLDKGVIFDMINGNQVFMTADSAFNYIDTYVAAKLMVDRLDKKGIVDIGAKNIISIGEIAEHFKLDVDFGDRKEFQDTQNPDEAYPDAREVLDYIEKLGIVK
ncbi:MAG: NAD(P)-dependent oxidoreductase [Chitinophagales bacterium]